MNPQESAAVVTPEAAGIGQTAPHATEYIGIVGFFVLITVLGNRVYEAVLIGGGWMVLATAIAGFVVSDLVSGLVHWLFDTWGSTSTPILGKTFIVPFRVHHSDPIDITRVNFIKTNGHNCFVSLPVLIGALWIPHGTVWGAPLITFIVMLCMGVFATNQFHKWAHQQNPHPIVAWLQKMGLILGREHHQGHHTFPYLKHYCITTGWLNRPLDAIKFFRGLEWVITKVTGVPPRKDDLEGEVQAVLTANVPPGLRK